MVAVYLLHFLLTDNIHCVFIHRSDQSPQRRRLASYIRPPFKGTICFRCTWYVNIPTLVVFYCWWHARCIYIYLNTYPNDTSSICVVTHSANQVCVCVCVWLCVNHECNADVLCCILYCFGKHRRHPQSLCVSRRFKVK